MAARPTASNSYSSEERRPVVEDHTQEGEVMALDSVGGVGSFDVSCHSHPCGHKIEEEQSMSMVVG